MTASPDRTVRTDPVSVTPTPPAFVGRLRSILWTQLPTLLVSSAAVSAVAAPVLLLVRGVTPVSLLLWALLVAPIFSALVAQAQDMLFGRAPGTFSLPTYLRRVGRRGVAAWLPPAAAGACTLVAVHVWHQTHSTPALGSAAVGGLVAALLTLAAMTAVPLGAQHPDLRGLRLTVTGLHLCAHRPVPLFAVGGLLIAAVSTAVHVTASLLFLLPGPLALVLVAAVWTTADASGVRPQAVED